MISRIQLAGLLALGLSGSAVAQTNFYLEGYGRAVLQNDRLDGQVMENDTVSPNRAFGGYTLFDLKPTLESGDNFRAMVDLRTRGEFGQFFGLGTTFEFRQIRLEGVIKDAVYYEVGDIYVSGSPYTVFNPDVTYDEFESDIFSTRREILEYENFNRGNDWFLQGFQARSTLLFDKYIQKLSLHGFGTRTNASNTSTTPDRVFVGGRVGIEQSDLLSFGGNYAGVLDVPVDAGTFEYTNNVITGDLALTFRPTDMIIQLKGEAGSSSFTYEDRTLNQFADGSDFFFDAAVEAKYEPINARLKVGYRDVGPDFRSPGAQTRRINDFATPAVFPTFNAGADTRGLFLYDRFTQEGTYNRGITNQLQDYLPQYGIINPYGAATPNRSGVYGQVNVDSIGGFLRLEAGGSFMSEVKGEQVSDLRSFLGFQGGVGAELHNAFGWEKRFYVSVGGRHEDVVRDAGNIDLAADQIDAGLSAEIFRNFELQAGVKYLSAKGDEIISTRDQFNQITGPATPTTVDLQEEIISFGFRVNFATNSFFSLTGQQINVLDFTDGNDDNEVDWQFQQLFFNYTLRF